MEVDAIPDPIGSGTNSIVGSKVLRVGDYHAVVLSNRS